MHSTADMHSVSCCPLVTEIPTQEHVFLIQEYEIPMDAVAKMKAAAWLGELLQAVQLKWKMLLSLR